VIYYTVWVVMQYRSFRYRCLTGQNTTTMNFKNAVAWANNQLGQVPTTQLRVVGTMGIIWGTAIKYWASTTWIPDSGWLYFLVALSGADVAHFFLKRKTAWEPDSSNGDDSSLTPPTTGSIGH